MKTTLVGVPFQRRWNTFGETRSRNLALKLLLLSLLLPVSSTRSKDLEEDANESTSEEEKPIEESFEETSSENEFSLQLATTTEFTTTAETYRELTWFVADEKNVSGEFRPSAHLGEIKESRIGTTPFNSVHHIGFENEVDPGSYHEQLRNYQLVIQPTYTDQANQHGNFHQSFIGTVSGSSEEGKKEGIEQSGYVKFQNDPVDVPRIHYATVYKDQPFQYVVQPIAENAAMQQVYQNQEKPVYEQNAPTYFGKPFKFHDETQKHELGSFASTDPPRSSYFGGGSYDHQRPHFHDFDALKRPNNGIVYAQESTFMRTRKFPYSFYQPAVGYHQIEFVNDDQPVYPVRKRVSPWKKILHLIGAFLPFGLLLAALTPNVAKLGNTSQPNIVLSKLRVADLPVEHKQARFIGELPNVCEERSICELILAGGEAGSSVLQNLLWNLATRTSIRAAMENELREIFEAVKKKNCTKVAC